MVEDGEFLNRIRALLKIYPRGLTISEISQRLKCNRNSVAKYLEILQISGTVEMQQMGAAKVYYLSQRVPLSNLLGFTKEGIIVIANEGRIIQINEKFCKMFDLDSAAMLGMSYTILPDELKKAFAFEVFLNPESESEHTSVITFNKYDWKRYFKVKYIRTVFDDGRPGLTTIVEDVTLETEMEERLRLNEARFRGIVEDQTELICRYNHNGAITFANGAFCRQFHMSATEAVRHSLFEFLSEDTANRIRNCMNKSSYTKPVFEVEFEFLLPSERLRWYHWINRALTDENDLIIEFQGVGRDITDRKRIELELKIKSQAMDSSIIPIGLASLEGLVTYVNKAFLDLWGYQRPDDVTGLPIGHFTGELSDTEGDLTGMVQSIPVDGGYSREICGIKRDGTKIHLSVTVSVVLDSDNLPICLIAYFYDITHRVKMVRELQIKDTAIAHSYEGMAIITPDDIVMYANPSFRKLFSRVPEDTLVGRSIEWCMSFYPHIIGSIPDMRAALIKKGNYTHVFSEVDDTGIDYVIQMHLSRAYDGNGVHLCTLISVLDITSQRAVEESLALMVNQFEATVEQIGDPTFIISYSRMVVAWNAAMEVFTGIRKTDMIGSSRYQDVMNRIVPSLPILVDLFYLPPKELIQLYPHVSRVGSTFYTETYVTGFHDGKGTYVWAKASPIIDATGRIIGYMQTIKDMTNWKRAVESATMKN